MNKSALAALIVTIVVFAGSLAQVRAGETPWRDIALGASIRVITSDQVEEGRTLIGIELAMLPGQKTYWYVPGETGIPIEFQLASRVRVLDVHPYWPFPKRLHTGGYVDNVYEGRLIVPLSVEMPPGGQQAHLRVRLGVCSDICVPVDIEIALPAIRPQIDVVSASRLSNAMFSVPKQWPNETPSPVALERFDPETGALWLRYDAPSVAPSRIFATRDGEATTYGEPKPVANLPGTLKVDRLSRSGSANRPLGPLRLTFAYKGQPFTLAVPSPQR